MIYNHTWIMIQFERWWT